MHTAVCITVLFVRGVQYKSLFQPSTSCPIRLSLWHIVKTWDPNPGVRRGLNVETNTPTGLISLLLNTFPRIFHQIFIIFVHCVVCNGSPMRGFYRETAYTKIHGTDVSLFRKVFYRPTLIAVCVYHVSTQVRLCNCDIRPRNNFKVPLNTASVKISVKRLSSICPLQLISTLKATPTRCFTG